MNFVAKYGGGGGSQPPGQIESGLVTMELNSSPSESTSASEETTRTEVDMDNYGEQSEEQPNDDQQSNQLSCNNEETPPLSNQQSQNTDETPSSQQQTSSEEIQQLDESDSSTNTQIGKKHQRSEMYGYKQKKLKKKVSADSQVLHYAEKEMQLKEKMIEKMETMNKEHRETMNSLTN